MKVSNKTSAALFPLPCQVTEAKKTTILNCKQGLYMRWLSFVIIGILMMGPVVSNAQAQLVISQVYGGGGNVGASYRNDFVELFNPTGVSVNVTGWSIQYASSTGGTWAVTSLTNVSILPGKYYLVQLASNGAIGSPMPAADAIGVTNMSATAGKVALVNSSTALSGTCPAVASYVDLVGFGTGTNCSETALAPAGSNSNSIFRANAGCTDTNNNLANFSAAMANPRNSLTAANICPDQNTADFRSISSGDFNSPSIWEYGSGTVWIAATQPPGAGNACKLQSGFIYATAPGAAQRVIKSLVIESGVSFTLASSLEVAGTNGIDVDISGALQLQPLGGSLLVHGDVSVQLTGSVVSSGAVELEGSLVVSGIFSGMDGSLKFSGAVDNMWIDNTAAGQQYGSVTVAKTAARVGRNPQTGRAIMCRVQSGRLDLLGGSPFEVSGSVIVDNAAVLDGGSSALSVTGDWLVEGTFDPGTGSVEFKGGDSTRTFGLPSPGHTTLFYKLIITKDGAHPVVLGSDAIVMHSLELNSGIFDVRTCTQVAVSGDVSVAALGVLRAGVCALSCAGDWSNLGVFEAGSSTVTFTCTDGSCSLSGEMTGSSKFHHVQVDCSSSVLVVSASMEMDGDLSVVHGTMSSGTCGTGTCASISCRDLSISPTAVLALGSLSMMTCSGSFSNLGQLSAPPVMRFTCTSGACTVSGAMTGTNRLQDAEVECSSGTCNVVVTGDMEMSGALRVLSGTLSSASCGTGTCASMSCRDLSISATSALDISSLSMMTCSGSFSNAGSFKAPVSTHFTCPSGTCTLSGGMENLNAFDQMVFTGSSWTSNDPVQANSVAVTAGSVQLLPRLSLGSVPAASTSFTVTNTGTMNTGTLRFMPSASSVWDDQSSSSHYGAVQLDNGVSLSMGTSVVRVSGNWINDGAVVNPGTSTVEFTGSGHSVIGGSAVTHTFRAVKLAKDLTGLGLRLPADVRAADIISTLGTIEAQSGSLQVSGDWTMSGGSFDAGTGTVVLSGSSLQTIGGTSPTTFHHLTLDNIAGAIIEKDETITGTLALTHGVMSTGSNTVMLTGGADVSRTAGWVNGRLQKFIPASASISKTWEIGDAGNYTPVDLVIRGGVGADVLAHCTALEHPQIASSAIDPSRSVNRFWQFSGLVTFTDFDATFHFVPNDVDATADPGNFSVAKIDDVTGTWSTLTTGTRTATSTQALAVLSECGFILGEPSCSPSNTNYRSTASGSWSDPTKWEYSNSCTGGSFTPAITPPVAGSNVQIVAGHVIMLDNDVFTNGLSVQGTLSCSSHQLHVAGSMQVAAGAVFDGGTGHLFLDGSSNSVIICNNPSLSLFDLTISCPSLTVAGSLSLLSCHNVQLSSGSTCQLQCNSMYCRDLTLSPLSHLDASSVSLLTCDGSYSNAGQMTAPPLMKFTCSSGTCTLSGEMTGSSRLHSVQVDCSSSTVYIAGGMEMDGDLQLVHGTLATQTCTPATCSAISCRDLSIALSSTLDISSASLFTVSGSFSNSGQFTAPPLTRFTCPTGTCTVGGVITGGNRLRNVDMHCSIDAVVVLSGNAEMDDLSITQGTLASQTCTPGTCSSISCRDLSISPASTLDVSSLSLMTCSGSFSNLGELSAAPVMKFTCASGACTVSGAMTGSNRLQDAEVECASGTCNVVVIGDMEMSGDLRVLNGKLSSQTCGSASCARISCNDLSISLSSTLDVSSLALFTCSGSLSMLGDFRAPELMQFSCTSGTCTIDGDMTALNKIRKIDFTHSSAAAAAVSFSGSLETGELSLLNTTLTAECGNAATCATRTLTCGDISIDASSTLHLGKLPKLTSIGALATALGRFVAPTLTEFTCPTGTCTVSGLSGLNSLHNMKVSCPPTQVIVLSGDLSVEDMTVSSGHLSGGSSHIVVSGDWEMDGEFDEGTSSVQFSGAGNKELKGTVSLLKFYDMEVAKTGGGTIKGNINISSGPAMRAHSVTLHSGTLEAGTFSDIAVSGDWIVDDGAVFTYGSCSVTFDGVDDQTIGGTALATSLGKAINTKPLTGTANRVTIPELDIEELVLNSGKMQVGLGNVQDIKVNISGPLTVHDGAVLSVLAIGEVAVAGDMSVEGQYDGVDGKLTLNGTSPQTMTYDPASTAVQSNFGDVSFSNTSTTGTFVTGPATALWLSRKGYDYYKARSDMHLAFQESFTIGTGASMEVTGARDISVGSDWTNLGTFTAGSSTVRFTCSPVSCTHTLSGGMEGSNAFSRLVFSGGDASSSDPVQANDVEVSAGSVVLSPRLRIGTVPAASCSFTVSNTGSVTTGTLRFMPSVLSSWDDQGSSSHIVDVEVDNGATVSLGSSKIVLFGGMQCNGSVIPGTSEVTFAGSNDVSLSGGGGGGAGGLAFSKLTLDKPAGHSLTSAIDDWSVGDWVISSGVMDCASSTIHVKRSLTNNCDVSCFVAGSSRLVMDGSVDCLVGGSSFIRTGGVVVVLDGGHDMVLSNDLRFSGELELTSGMVTTGSHTLECLTGCTVTGGSSASFVNGKFKSRPEMAATVNKRFDVGTYDGTTKRYSPVTMQFTDVTATGAVTVSATEVLHPSFAGSGLSLSNRVTTSFVVDNDPPLAFGSCAMTLSWDPTAVMGTMLDTRVVKFDNQWSSCHTVSQTPASITIDNLTSFGDFLVGDGGSCGNGVWTGLVSSDWSNPSNWCNNIVPDASTDVYITPATASTFSPQLTGPATCRNLVIPAAALLAGQTYTLSVYGSWTNDGTFDPGTGTVDFTGISPATLSGTATHTFSDISVSKSSTQIELVVVVAVIAIRSMTIQSGTLTAGSSVMDVSGDWTNHGVFNAGSSTVRFTCADGSCTLTGEMTGSSRFSHVMVAAPSSIVYMAGGMELSGDLSLQQGTLSSGTCSSGSCPALTCHDISVSSSSHLDIGSLSVMTCSGSFSNAGQFTSPPLTRFTCPGGTCSVSGDLTGSNSFRDFVVDATGPVVTIVSPHMEMDDLSVLQGALSKEACGNGIACTMVCNDLYIAPSASLLLSSLSQLTCSGSYSNTGLFNAPTAVRFICPSGTCTVGGAMTGASSFRDFVVDAAAPSVVIRVMSQDCATQDLYLVRGTLETETCSSGTCASMTCRDITVSPSSSLRVSSLAVLTCSGSFSNQGQFTAPPLTRLTCTSGTCTLSGALTGSNQFRDVDEDCDGRSVAIVSDVDMDDLSITHGTLYSNGCAPGFCPLLRTHHVAVAHNSRLDLSSLSSLTVSGSFSNSGEFIAPPLTRFTCTSSCSISGDLDGTNRFRDFVVDALGPLVVITVPADNLEMDKLSVLQGTLSKEVCGSTCSFECSDLYIAPSASLSLPSLSVLTCRGSFSNTGHFTAPELTRFTCPTGTCTLSGDMTGSNSFQDMDVECDQTARVMMSADMRLDGDLQVLQGRLEAASCSFSVCYSLECNSFSVAPLAVADLHSAFQLTLRDTYGNAGQFSAPPVVRVTCADGSCTLSGDMTGSNGFHSLQVDCSSALMVATADVDLDGALDFVSGRLTLDDHDLRLSSSSVITGASSTSFVVTRSTGALQRFVPNSNTDVVYPIGSTASSYTPVMVHLSLSSSPESIRSRVADGVYPVYDPNGNPPVGTAAIVTRDVLKTYFETGSIPTGQERTLTVQWSIVDEAVDFTRSSCHISHFTNGIWDNAPNSAAVAGSVPGSFSVTRTGLSSMSPFTVFSSSNIDAEPGMSNLDITDLSDVSIDANTIPFNQVFKLKIPLFNDSFDNGMPAGSTTVRIDLGTKMLVDPLFNMLTAPLSQYFHWSHSVVAGHDIIIGDQYADIPADWFAQAVFNVVASSSCRSTIRAIFIVDNHASTAFLVDEDLNNNTANLVYTIPVTLTALAQPAICNGTATGNIIVTNSPGTTVVITNSTGTVVTAPFLAGTYTVTATAGSEAPLTTVCSESRTVVVTEPAAISIVSATVTAPILCHGGTGTVTIVATGGTATYSYTFNGQTNTTGVFTAVSPGTNLPYSVTDVNSCTAATGTITVTQPTGTVPDISLGSDYEANFFPNGSAGTEYTLVYNIAEIGGNPAVGDTLRIIRASGYTISFDAGAPTATIGGTVYPLDNSRWKIDDANTAFVSLILDPPPHTGPGVLSCSQRVYIAIRFKRITSNQSTFALSARLRRTNGEVNQANNLNSIVFSAE